MTDLAPADLLGMLFAGVLTIMVFSYLLGDNFLFQLAVHIFVGAAAGYAGAVAFHHVIRPSLLDPLFAQGSAGFRDPAFLASWALSLLLLLKAAPETSRAGALPVALLVGVAAAVLIGGGITGTLVPQSKAAMSSFSPEALTPPPDVPEDQKVLYTEERAMDGVALTLATILTLLYFLYYRRGADQFGGGEAISKALRIIRLMGQVFIAGTFGVLYAGALSAAILALTERVQFFSDLVTVLQGLFLGTP